jgi:hypothetical protein
VLHSKIPNLTTNRPTDNVIVIVGVNSFSKAVTSVIEFCRLLFREKPAFVRLFFFFPHVLMPKSESVLMACNYVRQLC